MFLRLSGREFKMLDRGINKRLSRKRCNRINFVKIKQSKSNKREKSSNSTQSLITDGSTKTYSILSFARQPFTNV